MTLHIVRFDRNIISDLECGKNDIFLSNFLHEESKLQLLAEQIKLRAKQLENQEALLETKVF